MTRAVSNVVAFPRRHGFDPSLDKRKSADYLGVSVRTFERLIAEDKIAAHTVRANGKLLFRLSDLDRLNERSA